ncbi:MAG TPA: hypothetical protein VJ830_01715 [Anaerolineales bacterium]|nr:hypothetical protein [Anaerolineales bacterium]
MRNKRRITWIAAVVIGFLLLVLRTLQPANRDGVVTENVQTPAGTLPSSTPVLTREPNNASCERPYPDSSIWNVPMDWSVAKIHPMSDLMMRAFFASDDWIGSDTTKYTPNMYWVSDTTPLMPVRLLKNRFRDAINDKQLQFGDPADVVWMPLPLDAHPAVGTDGQLVVINVDTGEEWGLNEGFVDGEGNWFANGVYRYHIENSGIPPEGFGQRGAGIGQLAGIVRRCEVDRSYIGHAVTLAYDYPCKEEVCQQNGWPASIPPFRKTDGRGTSAYDIPEGARLAIRPDVSEEQIVEVCDRIKGCVVWALNMQVYGGFIVDNSDHPKTYAEGDSTANWEPSVWTRNMLRSIPPEWYVVIDWNYPSTKVQ